MKIYSIVICSFFAFFLELISKEKQMKEIIVLQTFHLFLIVSHIFRHFFPITPLLFFLSLIFHLLKIYKRMFSFVTDMLPFPVDNSATSSQVHRHRSSANIHRTRPYYHHYNHSLMSSNCM